MKKILFFFLFAIAVVAHAQVKVDIRIDSLDRLVGEQANITLEVTAPCNAKVLLPEYRPGEFIYEDIELVAATRTDTTPLNDGACQTLTRIYTITSFADSTRIYHLPPLIVKVDDKEYESNALNLRYETIEVDTINADQFCAPKSIIEPELTWDELKLSVYLLGLVLLLAAVAGYLYYRVRTGKPLVKLSLHREKKMLPHQVALEAINRIKNERKWAEEDSKEYYTLLTDALRTYIAERYGFSAMEMTSSEIIERLMKETDEQRMKELRQLFTTADLVKFAKAQTMINENDMNLVNAIEFIQGTKVEPDPNTIPEPPVVSEEEKRSTQERRILIVTIIAIGIVAVGLLGWAVWDLYDLLS